MKCKVCGYEFGSNREYCPMCGSKVPEEARRIEAEEMSWNTYDFPKPKKPEDIEMHWPGMDTRKDGSVTVMSKDATEGFVRSASPVRTEEPPKKEEAPMPDPWASMRSDFPKPSYPETERPQPQMSFTDPAPAAPPRQTAPQPAAPQPQAPPQQSAPAPQQNAFPQGAWQMPQMQETPSWTPYNVQQSQPQQQMPPIPPVYVPSSFTQAYGAQYSQAQYTQPQTAWTVPSQPQPGQQVFVTQPAQPVFIQPAPVTPPVYAPAYPSYTAPQQPVQPQTPPAPVQPEPVPVPPAPAEPAVPAQPEPAPQPAPEEPEPAPATVAEPGERILEENIVATMEMPAVTEPAEPAAPAEPAEPEIPAQPEPEMPEIPAQPEPDENGRYPERFFTFNKRNEEFQQLLNKEYERLRALRGSDEDDLVHTTVFRKDTFQPTPAQDFFHSDDVSSDLTEFEKMLFESTKDAEGDETLAINRDRIKGAAFSAEDLIEPLPEKAGDTHPIGTEAPAEEEPEPETPEEPEVPLTKEELARRSHREKMEAMALAREKYFASLRTMTAEMKAVKEAEFKAQLEKEARIEHEPVVKEEVPEKTPEQIAAEKEEEARLAAEREAAEREAAIARAKEEMEAAKEAQRLEEEKAAEAAEEAAPAEEPEEEPAEGPETQPEEPAFEETPEKEEEKEPSFTDDLEIAEKEPQVPERNKTEVLNDVLDDVEEETAEKEKRERSHWFLKFLLALAIVIAAAEGGTYALNQYAPDSPASIIATGVQQNVHQFVQSGIDQIKAKFQKEEAEPQQPEEEPQQPEEEGASFVLSDLIAQNNKNIEDVVENLAIGYDSQRSYDIPGLASSQLVTDAAEKANVIKTLIAYNSSWIDFINGESQDCLDYLKADGTAYRSAVTFDKIGQITEQFKKLEIGEIRKTDDTYFAFAGETIEVTQEDTTAQSSGFMVYEMVPVGDDLKIKDYYNITN